MTLDETLHDAFESLSERLRAELRTAADHLTDSLRTERDQPEEEPVPVPAPAPVPAANPVDPDIDRLAQAVRSIGAARSLSEALDTLTDCAGREAARAAVLIVRGGRLRGWRLAGFEPDAPSADKIDIAEDDSGLLADAIRTGHPVSARAGASSSAPSFAAVPDGHPCERVALPIAIGGQVVAMLYVDEGTTASGAARRALNAPRLEILASYAARCLEAQTAFKAARWLLDCQDAAIGVRDASVPEPEPLPAADGADDGDAAARRYARLLVSEIKLYHEPAVVAGRRARDLATRLGDEIARARVLYDQRVPLPLRQRTDYFNAELVRTLADGDATLITTPQMTP
ncbi:MAG TPA: GAF domain-containing protein [Vicinamibacterales bacterium]|nr:GAF domain-containing protein [Vicinamibacterales bacterium]